MPTEHFPFADTVLPSTRSVHDHVPPAGDLQHVQDQIDKHGWFAYAICATPEFPFTWLYTLGQSGRGLRDLVVFGVDLEYGPQHQLPLWTGAELAQKRVTQA